MECELLRSPMISYRSLLYNTTVLYDTHWSGLSVYFLVVLLMLRSLVSFNFYCSLYAYACTLLLYVVGCKYLYIAMGISTVKSLNNIYFEAGNLLLFRGFHL